jgi:outer membrane protein
MHKETEVERLGKKTNQSSRHPSLILLFTLLSLTGCATFQPTDPYAPVSRRTLFDSDTRPYPDRHPAPVAIESPVTLDRCVEIALENNPEVAATGWEVSAAGSRLNQAQAGRWPTLSAEGGYTRFLDPQRLIPARFNGEPGFFDTELYRGDLILRLPIFTGGRIVNEIAATELLQKAEENRLSRTREELIFNVASTFYAILGQYKVIHSLEFSIQAMDEHLKQVSELLAAQKAARIDLLRTEVRLSDLRQNLVKEKNVLAVQRRVLANLLGVDSFTGDFVIEGELKFQELHPDTNTLVQRAMEQRSDYLAAKARLEAQGRRVDIARAGHLPTVSVQGNYGVRADSLNHDEDVGSVGMGVTIPLFEGGRVVAKVSEERSVLGAAQERLRKLRLQILQEVETAVLEILSSGERAKALDKAIEQAGESLRIERQKYDLGVGSMTDILDAQSALLLSETNYYRALADLRTAIARLSLAVGGGAS